MSNLNVAIIGGTGNQGVGLAVRLANAGHNVYIGSRSPEKGEKVAGEALELSNGKIVGGSNTSAVKDADFLLLTVPFNYVESTANQLKPHLSSNTTIIDVTVPLEFRSGQPHLIPSNTSGAEVVESCFDNNPVVGAFKTISAYALRQIDKALSHTIYVAGKKEDCNPVLSLVSTIKYAKAVRVGPLSMCRYIEGLVPLSIVLNKRLKSHMISLLPDKNPLVDY